VSSFSRGAVAIVAVYGSRGTQVRVLYVRNLMLSTTEATLERAFSDAAGRRDAGGCCVERVKKLKDYAFVHFADRADAITAMHALNGNGLLYRAPCGLIQNITRFTFYIHL